MINIPNHDIDLNFDYLSLKYIFINFYNDLYEKSLAM